MNLKEANKIKNFVAWLSDLDIDRQFNYPDQVIKVAIEARDEEEKTWQVHLWTDNQNPMNFHELAQFADGIQSISGCRFISHHGCYDSGTTQGSKRVRTIMLY